MNVLSLAPLCVLPASPLEQIDAAHAAGFDAVGLRLAPVLPSDIDVMADAHMQREIGRRLNATGLKVLDIEVFRIGPHAEVSRMVPAMEFAASLGARYMLCTSLLLAEHCSGDEPRSAERLAQLCEIGARLGIRPVLEFMIFRSIGTIEQALRMVEMVGHPNLGICVDALHLSRSGGTPAALREVDPRLLCYAQWCDAPAAAPPASQVPVEARYHRLFPGQGGLPLAELLEVLPPGVALSLEVPNRSMADLSARERAQALAICTRAWLGRWRSPAA